MSLRIAEAAPETYHSATSELCFSPDTACEELAMDLMRLAGNSSIKKASLRDSLRLLRSQMARASPASSGILAPAPSNALTPAAAAMPPSQKSPQRGPALHSGPSLNNGPSLSPHLSLFELSGRRRSLVPRYPGAHGKLIGAGTMDVSSDTVNTRVRNIKPMVPPACVMEELPTSEEVDRLVHESRAAIGNIVHKRDDRVVAIVGPCSIHDRKAAIEYAIRLAKLAKEIEKDVLVVMRVYFEKPRTTVGWKGLINDPFLDGSFKINTGLRWARELMLEIIELGLPVGTEWLDTITPQFISDVVSWGAIGARTTESQVHRQLVSGLSMPVGFKNGTGGQVDLAANAVISARSSHHYCGTTQQGLAAIVETTGNRDCHIILRGGTCGPNHTPEEVKKAHAVAVKCKVNSPSFIVDLSHGNSSKDYRNQPKCMEVVCQQIEAGDHDLVGIMCESNLVEGSQKLIIGQADQLVYGQSVTDSCVDFEETEKMLRRLASAVRRRREGSDSDMSTSGN